MAASPVTSRRQFIALGGAAAAALALPPTAVAEAVPIPTAAPAVPMPTWIVGTPGESDHEVVRAVTREAAIRFRAEDCEVVECGDEPFEACDCGACTARDGYEATRTSAWDGRPEESITAGDWIAEGFDACCDRCGHECSQDGGARSVNGVAVCEDCLTLADWDIVDPDLAAEMRAERQNATALAPSLSGRN